MEGYTLPTRKTLKAWEEVLRVTKAKSAFEIGFNLGNSAKILLNQGLSVHSIDIGVYPHVEKAMKKFKEVYPKFSYEITSSFSLNSTDYEDQNYDLVFIDGQHTVHALVNDMFFARALKVPYMLIDDYNDENFSNLVRLVDNYSNYSAFEYEIHSTYIYDASGGENKMVLLKCIQ